MPGKLVSCRECNRSVGEKCLFLSVYYCENEKKSKITSTAFTGHESVLEVSFIPVSHGPWETAIHLHESTYELPLIFSIVRSAHIILLSFLI